MGGSIKQESTRAPAANKSAPEHPQQKKKNSDLAIKEKMRPRTATTKQTGAKCCGPFCFAMGAARNQSKKAPVAKKHRFRCRSYGFTLERLCRI